MNSKKVLFLIPDGVGIRNYLYSDILNYVKQEAEITFWSPLPEEAFKEVKSLHEIKIEYKNIKFTAEGILTRLFKESSTYARLLYNAKTVQNDTILVNWRKENKSFKLRQLYLLAELIGSWASKKYERILNLEQQSKKYWKRSLIEHYKNELELIKPTSIFITHQRVSALMPICIAAKELNIPVITAIYSWDNLPKARLAVEADRFIVWSDYMKEEMGIYYPELIKKNIVVTGTPQFEFYSKSQMLQTREDFAIEHGLDLNKTWICFSGDDKNTSPNDALYLKDVLDAVFKNKKLENVQIIFRRCPADFSGRYDEVLNEYSNCITIDPLWHTTNSGWTSSFPKFEDVNLLVNLAQHCSLVVNVGSTMAHDFAILNKPCLYLKYNHNINNKWNVNVVYDYQHFRTMQGLDAVGWLNSPNEIAKKIEMALKFPDQVGKDRKKWLEKIVLHPLEENSKKIAHVLLNPN